MVDVRFFVFGVVALVLAARSYAACPDPPAITLSEAARPTSGQSAPTDGAQRLASLPSNQGCTSAGWFLQEVPDQPRRGGNSLASRESVAMDNTAGAPREFAPSEAIPFR